MIASLMITQSIKKLYNDQQFKPSLLAIFVNPNFLIRYNLFKKISSLASYMRGKMLDFGCGSKPYRDLFNVTSYVGLDIEVSGHSHNDSLVDVFYNGRELPFQNDSFDSVFSSEVFEHIFNIDEILIELHRVIKPGGYILLTCPFAYEEHETPYDYARYSSYGIKALLEKHNFKIIYSLKTGNYFAAITQFIITFFLSFFSEQQRLKVIFYLLFLWPISVVGFIFSIIFPFSKKLYLNNVVLAEKKS